MKLFNQEEGASLVLVGIAFMGIMMMAGLVLDGGALFMEKRNLQKAANAAVLSSAQELTMDQASVQEKCMRQQSLPPWGRLQVLHL